ncbi:Methyltransferase-related protein [Rhynchospora pubera]|uniref:Methyltransferase-related protein n=1 Tax=Rhynchospora pubera TaxID=906938 RepID=A0AAV8F3H3_9POAL|nr:Methyltransferase-related protein [Rhynchospora pubera]KAJ4807462.1 Methyltransferase-related protein [Rhynchospora pubera]
MCPLRIILIFLSATIAGFFVLRGLKTEPEFDLNQEEVEEKNAKVELPLSAKVGSAICGCFWTLVDMASGRYLWRTLVSPAASSEKKQ